MINNIFYNYEMNNEVSFSACLIVGLFYFTGEWKLSFFILSGFSRSLSF